VRRATSEAGLTLVELMMAVVVSGIAMSAVIGTGLLIGAHFRDHREMIDTERAARVGLEMIADSLRSASAGVTTGSLVDAAACTTTAGGVALSGLAVRNDAGGTTFPSTTWGDLAVEEGTDVLELIHATGGVMTTLTADFTVGGDELSVIDVTGFSAGDHVILTNMESAVLLRIGDEPAPGTLPVAESCLGTTPTFLAGTMVIRGRVSRWFLSRLGGESFPSLMLDVDGDGGAEPEPIAPGIEDLQIVLGVDDGGDGDGVRHDGILADEPSPGTTDDEWYGNVQGDPVPPPIEADIARPLRAVRVGLVARALDPLSSEPSFTRPALEDRAGADEADAFRRRVLSTIVELRNLDGSP
jgi:prepilin-type N-terminal cleavage/methylation domain-containing protein